MISAWWASPQTLLTKSLSHDNLGNYLIKAVQRSGSQAAAAAQARSQQSEEEVVRSRCFHMNHWDPRQHKYPLMSGSDKHKRYNDRRVAARAAGPLWSSAGAVGGAEPAAPGRGTFAAWRDLLSDSFLISLEGRNAKTCHHFVAVNRNTSSGSTAFQLVCRAERHHQELLRPRSRRCSGSSSSRFFFFDD